MSKAREYRRNHRAKQKTIEYYEMRGFRLTGGERGLWDFIAMSGTRVVLVKVMLNEWPRGFEMSALTTFKRPAWVEKEIVRWDDHEMEPVVRVI